MVRLGKTASILGISIATMLMTSSAFSATYRGYEKDGYSRVVVQSDKPLSYTIKEGKKGVYTVTLSSDSFDDGSSISAPHVKSASASGNQLTLTIPSSNTLRHFKTGKKIIIDVRGNATSSQNTQNTVKKTAPKAPVPVVKIDSTDKNATSKKLVDISQDHVIQLTATEIVSVAAFERHNKLWIVVDKPDFLIPPQINGPQADLFSPFERIELPQATAFRADIPNTKTPFHLYAEGGGLVWRLIATQDASKKKDSSRLEPVSSTLVWNDPDAHRILKITDPDIEDTITVITTRDVGEPITNNAEYVELKTLPSYVGVAFLPKTEDVTVSINPEYAVISKKNGLNVSDATDISVFSVAEEPPQEDLPDYNNIKRIYRFSEWQMGGISKLGDNERILLTSASNQEPEDRISTLLKLAHLELSNGRPAEADGFLELARDYNPDISESPQFIAAQAAAHALSGKYDLAFEELSHQSLKPYQEIELWKAYSLAGLEDWNQAGENLPPDVGLVSLYPSPLQQDMALRLSEIALRQGRVRDADDLLALVKHHEETLSPSEIATLEYLSGEAARQSDDMEEAKEFWTKLTEGKDDLYRAKAGLSLTRLKYDNGEMTADQAIDQLERLRYAWRGDDLETQINYRLGLAYINSNDYIRGLNIMRKAASRSPDQELAQEIAAQMSEYFTEVFTTDKINELAPIDTITLYEEFSELAPTGKEGDNLINQLAERLIDIDLLGRASTLLNNQVDNNLSGEDGAIVAIRLAGIQLADQKPNLALKSLQKADSFLKTAFTSPSKRYAELSQDIGLFRARAYSLQKKPDQALVTLSRLDQSKKVLQMRADVAWRANRWQSASEALEELINRENVSLNRSLSDEHRDLILNWAVTLNLSENRYILNSVRDRFGESMDKTSKAKEFEVITRPQKNVFLADRKTIESIVSEVDIFKDFLTSYKGSRS